jgi:hypothetical protein
VDLIDKIHELEKTIDTARRYIEQKETQVAELVAQVGGLQHQLCELQQALEAERNRPLPPRRGWLGFRNR